MTQILVFGAKAGTDEWHFHSFQWVIMIWGLSYDLGHTTKLVSQGTTVFMDLKH